MSQPRDRLYNLLPVIYRQRDEAAGQPLRALLAVIENEFSSLQADIAAAYDNWFIETSDAWVIPYLADLVGIADPDLFEQPYFGQRRLVANHVAYQRRKGLATILAHITRDISGWYAYVSDISQRVALTQAMKKVELTRGRTIDLRQGDQLALLGTPFDNASHTLDVRRVDADPQSGSVPGLASLNGLALYIWRLRSYPIRQAQAGVQVRVHRGKKTRHFTFDPLGRNLPLFIQPEAIENLSQPMQPYHFPQPLTRAMLAADLAKVDPDARSSGNEVVAGQNPLRYYGPQREIAIWRNGELVPANEIMSGQLDGHNTAYWDGLIQDLRAHGDDKTVVVDPQNGRFLLAKPISREDVRVNYTYSFSSDVGSGPYQWDNLDAGDAAARSEALTIDVVKSSAQTTASENHTTFSSLEDALDRWQSYSEVSQKPQAIIRILDSSTYNLPGLLRPRLPRGSFLSIEAAPGERPTIIVEEGLLGVPRPVEEAVVYDRRLRLRGLLISGPVGLPVMSGGKLDFQIQGCTLLHGLQLYIDKTVRAEIRLSSSMIESIAVVITNHSSATGEMPAQVDPHKGSLTIEDSIVRGNVVTTIHATQTYELETQIVRSTILGETHLASVPQVSDAILLGGMMVEQVRDVPAQAGGQAPVFMRYSYALKTNLPGGMLEFCAIGPELQPLFTFIQPAQPGYAQLRSTCPEQIRHGASNGAEMGVFNSLRANRREANLKRILPDYLPLGQELGIFMVT